MFVDKNVDYYFDKWGRAKNPKIYAGWNWAAFFFGVFWLGYRKMFKTLITLIIMFFLIDTVLILFKSGSIKEVNLFFTFICGLCGNTFYYNYMKKEIKKIKEINPSENTKLSFYGGVSWGGVGKATLIFVGYVILLSLLILIINRYDLPPICQTLS
jgi:hypothetical protein